MECPKTGCCLGVITRPQVKAYLQAFVKAKELPVRLRHHVDKITYDSKTKLYTVTGKVCVTSASLRLSCCHINLATRLLTLPPHKGAL